MPLHDFFGQGLDLSRWAPPVMEPEVMSPDEIFLQNLKDLNSLAQAVVTLAQVLSLDDYGLFRLMVFAIDHLTPEALHEDPLCPMGMAMGMGHWSTASRLFAIGALARAAGYAVVPHMGPPGEVLLYIPVEDDPEDLNANWRSAAWTFSEDGQVVGEYAFRWLVWDGVSALGACEESYPEGAMLPPEVIVSSATKSFQMYHRTLPEFVLQNTHEDRLGCFGHDGSLSFINRPDARAYLALFPEYRFGAQTKLAMQEASSMALQRSVSFLREMPEVERMNMLLRTLQHNFVYEYGPLRPLFDVLHSRQGDCDQLSLVFASLLRGLGYGRDDIVAMVWSDHLCLAVRPQEQALVAEDVVSFERPGMGRYYALDSTHFVRLNGKLVSTWGKVGGRHRDQPFRVEPLRLGRED